MWWVPVSWMLMLSAPAGEPTGVSGSSLPAPIHTRQAMFAIPYRIERGEQGTTEPVAVQLQVSVDGGKTWQVHSKIQPNLGRFQFRADVDGEYWFVVQTVDQQGRLRPPKPGMPGLRVVVDTAPPRMDLEAHRGPNGEITVRWRLVELNLDPESVRILYRTDVSPTMQSVAIDQNHVVNRGPVHFGDVSWWLPQGGNSVEIRGEVRDRAGNVSVTHAQLGLQGPSPAQAGAPPASRSAAPQSSAASQIAGTRNTQWRGVAENPQTPRQGQAFARPGSQQPAAPGGGPRLNGTPSTVPLHSASLPVPEASVAIQINPALGSQYPQRTSEGSSGEPRRTSSERPRMVSTRVFELEYAVDSIGSSGIAQVELWGTRDGGRTWTSFGTDQDKKSPFLVTVDEEGTYGFRITVRSGVGLGGEPPTNGTVPDLWVCVDLTRPDVRILSAEQLTGEESGKVVIRWEARDRMLAPQGVSLFYSAAPGGPWVPIATRLENSGQYGWLAGKDVPEQVYLRVDAQDEAGNLGIFESPQAIALDRRRPSVHIRDIRPVGQSDRAAGR